MTDFILHATVIINGKAGEISLCKDKIIWKYYDQFDKVTNILHLRDVISIKDNSNFFLKNRLIQYPKIIDKHSERLKSLRMVIYSITDRVNTLCDWNILSTIVYFDEDSQCSQWKVALIQLLDAHIISSGRPRSLAVFINPIGGHKKGVEMYDCKVRPIFELAGITTRVIVTQMRDEAKTYILEKKFQQVDGLVCVGGDGMLMELIQGLLLQARAEAGHSEEDHYPNSPEFPSALRVGIIAAGSTDSVAHSSTGTKDAVTSALHIVKGSSVSLDVITVHAEDLFIRYNLSLMGYGFLGNCVSESETFRWMGPKRYDWLGFKNLMSLATYYGELKYLPVADSNGFPNDGNMCQERCTRCGGPPADNVKTKDWVTVRDRFVAINSFLISCRCKRSPIGAAPFAHLGNGCTDLVIVRHCNRFNFLQHLLRSGSYEDHFDFDFVETVRVSQFSFTPLPDELGSVSHNGFSKQFSVWNCDGEPLYSPNVMCKVHRKLIRLFANGIPGNNGTVVGSVRSLAATSGSNVTTKSKE